MKECCGNYFILNGEIKPVSEFDNNLVYKGNSIYEVIRTTGGIPVFFNDHMERLTMSVSYREKEMIVDASRLRSDIITLAGLEKRKEINLKIVFNYRESGNNYLAYYIESSYPADEQYRKGVKGILYWAEREDPRSKILDFRMRSEIHKELVNENAYEALLVNNDNLITEGSKSNVFFIKNEILITAPDDIILKGVTRKHILHICREENIGIEFRCADADDLGNYESSFITGTSPMVLPLCCINERSFNVKHPLMERLRRSYMSRVEEDLASWSHN
jgi:branched-chain amino acid aminotransferase